MNKILIPCIMTSYRPLADKSWSISLNTNILNNEQKMIIDKLHQQSVYVLIKDSEIDNAESDLLNNLEPEFDGNKSLSQQQRIELWKNWKDKPEGFADFKDYYKHNMNKIIQHFKNKRN